MECVQILCLRQRLEFNTSVTEGVIISKTVSRMEYVYWIQKESQLLFIMLLRSMYSARYTTDGGRKFYASSYVGYIFVVDFATNCCVSTNVVKYLGRNNLTKQISAALELLHVTRWGDMANWQAIFVSLISKMSVTRLNKFKLNLLVTFPKYQL